jgi:hypothetical protein
MMRKSSALTVVAILSLALGIGANIFTIVDAVMLKILPVRNLTELVQLSGYYQDQRSNFRTIRSTSLPSPNSRPSKVRIGQEPENIDRQYVSGNY